MQKTIVSTRTVAFEMAIEALNKAYANAPNAGFTPHKTAGIQAHIAKIRTRVAKSGKVSELDNVDVTELQD
jgi:hypothetical protein